MSDDTLKPDTRIREYAIKRILGRGSFGITYLAEHVNDHFAVAIKEYFPVAHAQRDPGESTISVSSPPGGDNGGFQSGLERFLEESRTLSKFTSPHIVRVVDTFELNGTAYMVMQYEEGGTLAQYLKAHQEPLKPQQILSIFVPLLEGLRTIHAKWLLHRDIKPDNIYIRKDGSPLLIDFGTARHALSAKKGGMTEYFTAGFAPPEQYDRRADHGPWTDIYAVGVTMYYCITRITPYEGRFRTPDNDPVMPAVQAAPAFYDRELLEIVDWMMKPLHQERPQAVDDVLSRLAGLSADDGAAVEPEERPEKPGSAAAQETIVNRETDSAPAKTSKRTEAEADTTADRAGRTTPSDEGESGRAASGAETGRRQGDTEVLDDEGDASVHGGALTGLMPDNVTWATAAAVAAGTFALNLADEDIAGPVSTLVIIPLATLALAILRPLHFLTVAVIVLALQGIALTGYVMGGGRFGSYDETALLVLILAANVLICALAAFLARRHARASGASGEMDPSD